MFADRNESLDADLAVFYDRLLAALRQTAFRDGKWQLLDAWPAWEGNGSNDAFICYAWTGPADERRLVVVNYAAHQSQSYVHYRGRILLIGSGASWTRWAKRRTSAKAQNWISAGFTWIWARGATTCLRSNAERYPETLRPPTRLLQDGSVLPLRDRRTSAGIDLQGQS